jgi:LuxR family maltose regulon positive regulatory protein
MTRSRQLAAIMFTDIVGYTSLMQQNEEKAIQAREKHRQIFNSTTEKYNGRILQYYGDGTLSIFDSAIDAVKCGTEMQLGFQKDPAIPVRIGIHTGDIIFSEEEIIGDGVNVASRIESLAVPGSVFISDKVYDEIKNQESIKTSMLKTFKLKNVEKPIKVYAISNIGLIVPTYEDVDGRTDTDLSPVEEKHEQPKHTPEPILATKLYIPHPRPKVVIRLRLVERLNAGLQGKLTLISAPPGFGKTTLISQWIAEGERPTAWLSLDEGDNDPVRFLTHLVAAFQTIAPNIGGRALSLVQSPQPPPDESILTSLLNDITTIPDPFTLVLDDYHVIDAQPVDNAITFLLEHQTPQMHLAITTREDPNLPLPRLRVRGQLTELRSPDLRFTPSESTEFINHVMGLNLSEDDIAALEASTEGWVAGLQLAALSMHGREDISGFIRAFAGNDRHVVDYLVEEVLLSQPEHIRNFLLQTSILDRLCNPLCNAVTGQEEGKGLLEDLERGNLFVVPLDDKRQWYRYHHLFAEVLHARSMEEDPDRIPVLHRRASEWYELNGLPAEAVRHALSSKDFVRSAGLIELAWPSMDRSCQATTWLGWVRSLPEELICVRPVLSVGYAWALLECGELEPAEDRLNDAERLLNPKGDKGEAPDAPEAGMMVADEEQFRRLPASIANARAYHAQALGDVPGTLKYAQQALDLVPENDYLMRAIPAAMVGFVHMESGDLVAAHRTFTDLRASFQMAGDISGAISFTFILADINMAQGYPQQALSLFEQSLKLAMDQGEPSPMGTEDLYRGLGELYFERGDLKTCLEYLQKGEKLGEQSTGTDWRYRQSLAQARLKEAQGDLDDALGLLKKAEGLWVRNPLPDLRPVAALRTRVWIRQGKLAEALGWIRERGLSYDDELTYLHEFEHIILARVLIALFKNKREDKSIHQAMELLDRLLKSAEEGNRAGSIMEILVLQALAHEAQGNIPLGLVPLERAMALAESEVYVRIFVDEGTPMAKLLSEAADHEIMPDYTGKLLAEFKA